MPCHGDSQDRNPRRTDSRHNDSRNNDGQDNSHGFPLFPADFEPDTAHLLQAIAEHNYRRTAAGLPTQNYFQLSVEDRAAACDRANELKFAFRAKVFQLKQAPSQHTAAERAAFLPGPQRFSSIGTVFLLSAGILTLIVYLARFL